MPTTSSRPTSPQPPPERPHQEPRPTVRIELPSGRVYEGGTYRPLRQEPIVRRALTISMRITHHSRSTIPAPGARA